MTLAVVTRELPVVGVRRGTDGAALGACRSSATQLLLMAARRGVDCVPHLATSADRQALARAVTAR